ncbi:cyclin-D1-binding protein 1 homolog [Dendronephthya gigantea]|uniref:cyclin-D1-binding protein 1 homolog n=1 Tax=Dendronephthya gigantea TaxID=151771 RepID=UPI00106CBFB6|nr:cyclin-D1-binding protein 1 homolog [Dendronephthya gigantea]
MAAANLDVSTLQIVDDNPFKSLEESLHVLLHKLKEEATLSIKLESAKLHCRTAYWNTLGNCIQAVSKECTKLSLAFTKPPLPSHKDTVALANGLNIGVTAVFETYKAFDQREGALLHNVLRTYVMDLTKTLANFVSSLRHAKKDEILKTVGVVWECCECFTTIPKDIKELALKETKSCFGLINDAIAELEEYQQEWKENCNCDVRQNETENMSPLDNLNEQPILASIGIAKVAKSLLKKVTKCFSKNAQNDDVCKINELDTIAQTIKLVSPSVDNLFCGVYSESLTEVQKEGLELVGTLEKIIQLCRSSHFCLDEDKCWLDFLYQALDHNFKKFTITDCST